MTRLNSLLILLIYLLLGVSCQSPSTDSQNSQPQKLVASAYQPPAFQNDNRVEQIKELAPALEEIFNGHASKRRIPGVAYGIVVDDQLVFTGASGLMNREKEWSATTNTAFRIASMSKSFTAMGIMILRDEGKLALSDPAVSYLPEMANLQYLTSDAPVITIENLLTMTAGFPEDNPWGDRQLDEPDQMLMDLMSDGPSFSNPPSYGYEYSNTGYALLGSIISKVAQQPYQDFVREKIFQPLGMNDTYWEIDEVPKEQLAIGYRWEDEQWKLEPMLHDGAFGAMGGLVTTIEDFSKYVSFHLSAWPPRSGKEKGPLKRSSLREMHTPQFARLSTDATGVDGEPCPLINGYGYGLGIRENCEGFKWISHGGALPGFGSNYAFFPDYGIGVMAFGNLTYTGPLPLGQVVRLLFDEAGIAPRELPTSSILAQRQKEVVELITEWPQELEDRILAENFYLDRSREKRKREAEDLLSQLGNSYEVGPFYPDNQLRGGFNLIGTEGYLEIYFTLSPEPDPKIQRLNLSYQPGKLTP